MGKAVDNIIALYVFSATFIKTRISLCETARNRKFAVEKWKKNCELKASSKRRVSDASGSFHLQGGQASNSSRVCASLFLSFAISRMYFTASRLNIFVKIVIRRTHIARFPSFRLRPLLHCITYETRRRRCSFGQSIEKQS